MMPKRPRSHELEDESRVAFASRVPSGWVVRHQANDYGVDEEVEVFEDGMATGLTFKVQLKGTDSKLAGRDPYVRVSRATANYWQQLDTPVLVALYAAQTDVIYVRWAHGVLLEPPSKRANKSLTVTFGVQDAIDEAGFARILDDLKVIRAIRRGRSDLPLPLRILVSERVQFTDRSTARMLLRDRLRSAGDVFFEAKAGSHAIVLEVTDKLIQARMPTDLSSATLQYDRADYVGEGGNENLVGDVIICLSSLMVHERSVYAAKTLMERFGAYERGGPYPTAMLQLFEAFYEEGFTEAALNALESVLDCGYALPAWTAFEVLRGTLLSEVPRYTETDVERILATLEQIAAREESEGRNQEAAQTRYLMCNVWRSGSSWDASLAALDDVVRLDPRYADRGYYWRERGGVLYERRQFEQAADCYSKSIALNGPPESHLLLSDVSLDTGQYRVAAETAERGPSELRPPYATGSLINRRQVKAVSGLLAIGTQERRPMSADELASLSSELTDQTAIAGALRTTDGLDPRLWCLLAVHEHAQGAHESEMDAFLVAAKSLPLEPRVWVSAMYAGVEANISRALLEAICEDGMRFAGGPFALMNGLSSLGWDSESATYRSVADLISARSESPPTPQTRTVRQVYPDGSFVEHVLP